jgi:hypothetical protein
VKKHARLRLSAKTALAVFLPGVETGFKSVKHWNSGGELLIDALNNRACLQATPYVRLIAYDDEEESC